MSIRGELLRTQVYRDLDSFYFGRQFAFLFEGGKAPFWAFAFPTFLATFLLPLLVPQVFFPLSGYADMIDTIALLFIWPSFHHKVIYPIAKPKVEGGIDLNVRKAGMGGGYEQAGGIAWMGTIREGKKYGQQVFLTNTMLRAHLFFLGTTGAGKTQTMLGFLWSFLVMGSGFTLIDGKGDIKTWHMICSMAWLSGREDDLLLVNYTTGDTTLWDKPIERQSITINLFADGSLNTVSGLVKSLLGEAPKGDNRIWHERTVSFIEAVLTPLVYLRDYHNFQLSTQVLRDYINLPAVKLLRHKRLKVNGKERYFPDIPDRAIEPIKAYLMNLPGYNDTPPPDYANDPQSAAAVQAMPQVPGSEEENKQHGFVTMQLIRSLNAMSDSFGHIFSTKYTELNWDDVAINRRIVITILPSLEKPPSDMEILGKIIVAGNKMMLARLLGNQISKGTDEKVDQRITDADHPYCLCYDEKASYMVEGEEDILAQGRSLGVSVVIGSQDMPRLTEKSKAGAAAIASCTSFKGAMKLQDDESIQFAIKSMGKTWMRRAQYYKVDTSGLMANTYMDNSDIVENTDRVDPDQIRALKSGQMFVNYDGQFFSLATAYFPWPTLHEWRISHGACVPLDLMFGDVAHSVSAAPEPLDTVLSEPFPGDPPAVAPEKVLAPEPMERPIVNALDQKTIAEMTAGIARKIQEVSSRTQNEEQPDEQYVENTEWSG
ncbi:TraM recognition domain-containing protein [Acidithiobacillus sp. CV18-2]|nr:TraM recognition domain-containing protein [Acidithiobacillus sp. CV18-3]MBU2756945.1 TraM recognition domain-containing protein [Acidithiobacillus sp. BN09-2]MBU2777556.1 TraM recognition domain-containing protein [Acidithiobacillus sp. CV18-2]MBU2799656.1 TraM recognition domain-containing protein [Acidithiobacillus sp. VAN18-4]